MKGNISKEEEIRIRKCRIISWFYIISKEVKVYISSSKQQESPPETTNTKEDIRLEKMKKKAKRAALEWDDFVP